MSRTSRTCVLGAVLAAFALDAAAGGRTAAQVSAADAALVKAGAALYLRGISRTGDALTATREGDLRLKAAEAACVNCHRRSGLGSTEGSISIPPITGEYLFHDRASVSAHGHELTYVENAHANRAPYSPSTFARALRLGIDSDGHQLSALMPRFEVNDSDLDALIAYLQSLDARRAPGVMPTLLHFATIFTPDTDPRLRQAVLDVIQQFFQDKNGIPMAPSPPMRTSGGTLYSKSMYVANRHWELHVWDLAGPPTSWRAQLDRDFEHEPVMAVISGLGGSRWGPVHDFCEQRRVPCLFPNVEAPVMAEGDFYSVYLSKGVLLEAELIARSLERAESAEGRRILQVFRASDSGELAAAALKAQLERRGFVVQQRVLPAKHEGEGVESALRGANADALVLWLRPRDIAALGTPPPRSGPVYLSGLMGGLESAPLSAAWRVRTHIAYPVDLPDRRVVRLDYPLGWFRLRHLALVDERVQADTYLACGILAETLKHMADTLVPDYLVEELQTILDHRILTGYYPRLTLASGQTIGSKGGYVVRFADASGTQVVSDGDWMVP